MNAVQYLLVVFALTAMIAIPLLPVASNEISNSEEYAAANAFEPSCWDPSYAPEAAFDFTINEQNPYYYASFDASPSRAGVGAIVTCIWDFGDGTAGSGVRVSHTYHETYDIVRFATLTITNSRGCTDRSVEAIDLRKTHLVFCRSVTVPLLPRVRVPEWLPFVCYVGAILALLGVLLLG